MTNHTRARSTLAACLAVGAVGIALAGCSVSTTTSASGDDVANSAEDSFEESIGQRPEVECADSIELTVGETMTCTLTDPSTGTKYDMLVTVEDDNPDGSGLNFQVADEPQG
ncbi:DUF4333 domain-containing protein [Cellulosimicrobium terreum]|nr:DUF4333 domain-containing protein [Cellulosimicrobium terreum]